MKRTCLLIASLIYGIYYSQPCTPSALSFIENQYIKAGVSNMGDFYPGVIGGNIEYPKRTPIEITNGVRAKSPIFSGSVWISSKTNGNISFSGDRYRSNSHFLPGPIRLLDGIVDLQNCQQFDRVWIAKTQDIKDHITKWMSGPTPLTNINNSILDWPAKGNKRYTIVPIEDDLAPFVDVNSNGIYDPENGDYPNIKGDEAHFTVVNDISTGRMDSPMIKAVGVEMQTLTYIYYSTIINDLGTSIFHECKIIKKTAGTANDFIFSFFVDSDLGNFNDDYIGCDTLSNSGFTYNADSYDEGVYLNNPPVVITSFMNRKMGAFVFFINGQGGLLNDPVISNSTNTFNYARNVMEGKTALGGNYTVSSDCLTPGYPITKYLYFGNPSDSNQWSMTFSNFKSMDFRYLMSSTPLDLEYNKPQNFNFVTYIHQFNPYISRPNFRDSIIPILDKIKNNVINKNCNITLTAKITPDTNGMKKGKIELITIGNSQGSLNIKWSTNETSQSITSKDSGKYRVVIIDANNCMKDSTFYIPNTTKASGSIALTTNLDNISIFPNPFQNQLTITNPNRIALKTIYIHDIIGKLVYQKNINEKNEKLEISLSLLPRGNYHLYVETDQGVKNFKISK